MKLKNIALLFTLSLGFFQVGFAQEKKKEKADKLYEKYAYVDAIKAYEEIAKEGYIDQDMLEKLGDSYYFNADYLNAVKWYDKLFKGEFDTSKISAEYYYRYAQSLKTADRYDEANVILEKFTTQASATDRRASLFSSNKDYLKEIVDNSGRLQVVPTSINTEHSEYGLSFYGDTEAVFTASGKPRAFKASSKWTGDGYYDLYKTKVNEDGTIEGKEKFSSVLNTKFNESTPVFTQDLLTVYFTRNFEKKENLTDDDIYGTHLLKLYKSTRKSVNDEWSEAELLPFNQEKFSVAHPALTPDEQYLYFASDIPGTKGKSDIFRVKIIDGGANYSLPENVGDINTEGRETFPFITKEGILYFSSDGHPGLGGLDIFGVKINPDGSLTRMQNIGRPGNSASDDFAYVVNSKTNKGFFTSNRQGGKGKDDIYSFTENPPLNFDCFNIIKGIVRDIDTKEILTDVKVTLSDKLQKEMKVVTNAADGTFNFERTVFDCKEDYVYVRAQKENYSVEENKVEITGTGEDIFTEIMLKTTKKPLKVGDNLGDLFDIKIIYFDFDKSNIRPDAARDIAKIIQVMKDHPTMKVEITSHTDSRGSDAYNMALSDRRAKSTLEWMVKKGISRDRLTAKGYGESQLVNECSNGVPCSEEAHQLNRRSQFIITAID